MKTALVTGASSGIGAATARRLDREGYRLVLVARREDALRRVADELRDATVLPLDLTADDAPLRAAEAVRESGLDLLVNNAGSSWHGAFADKGFENLKQTFELNVFSVVRLTEALLPILRASAPSAIVNVSSVAGRIAQPKHGAYAASKFALCGWSEALRGEERRHGVHVGLVMPGFVRTEGFPQTEVPQWAVSRPEKVADAVVRAAGGKGDVYVPRPWAIPVRLRYLVPGVFTRVAGRARS